MCVIFFHKVPVIAWSTCLLKERVHKSFSSYYWSQSWLLLHLYLVQWSSRWRVQGQLCVCLHPCTTAWMDRTSTTIMKFQWKYMCARLLLPQEVGLTPRASPMSPPLPLPCHTLTPSLLVHLQKASAAHLRPAANYRKDAANASTPTTATCAQTATMYSSIPLVSSPCRSFWGAPATRLRCRGRSEGGGGEEDGKGGVNCEYNSISP